MPTQENTIYNTFMGNLNSQGYSGKDGNANLAADVYGAGTGALYTGLATAAGEVGKLPGPIGYVGTVVGVTVGVVTSGSSSSPLCTIVGTVVGAGVGIGGAAAVTAAAETFSFGAATPLVPVLAYTVGTATGTAATKGVTALCQTALGYVNGEAPSTPATVSASQAQLLQNSLATQSQLQVPAAASMPAITAASSTLAAQVIQFRPSPDYTGNAGCYTVQSGQTLSGIAAANGISLATLVATNPQISDPNSIRSGQVIQLPTSASGYVPGAADPNAAVPNGGAQYQSLSAVLQYKDQGAAVDIVAENSGKIDVVSNALGTVVVIADNGTATNESLATFNSQIQQTYNNYVSGGYLTGATKAVYSDYADDLYGAVSANGQTGVVIGSGGAMTCDVGGDVAAQTSTGNLYVADASTATSLFAADYGTSATLGADTQSRTSAGSMIDDSKSYASSGNVQGEAVETTTSSGASTVALSGINTITTASNSTLAYSAGSVATVGGANDAVTDGANSTVTLKGTGDTLVGSSDTINLPTQSSTLQLNGTNDTLNSSTFDSVNLLGANINLINDGPGGEGGTKFSIASSGDNIKGSVDNFDLTASGLSLTITGQRNVAVDNGGESYTIGSNSTLNFDGTAATGYVRATGDTINVTGTNDQLTSMGPDTYNFGSAGLNDLVQGRTPTVPVTVNATGDTIDLVGETTVNFATGSGDTINIDAANDVVTASGDTLDVSGRNVIPTLTGSNDTLNATDELIDFDGSHESLTVNGYDQVEVAGTGDTINASNDTIQLNASNETDTVVGSHDIFGVVGGCTNDKVIDDLSNGTSIVASDTNGSSWTVTDYTGANGSGTVDGGYTTGVDSGSGGDTGGNGGDAPISDTPPDTGGYYAYSASMSGNRNSLGHSGITGAAAHDRSVTASSTSTLATPLLASAEPSSFVGQSAGFVNFVAATAPNSTSQIAGNGTLPSTQIVLPASVNVASAGGDSSLLDLGPSRSSSAIDNLIQSMASFGAERGFSGALATGVSHDMLLNQVFATSRQSHSQALR